METFNFTFYAQGVDREDALRILTATWEAHCVEYGHSRLDPHVDLQSEWGVSFVDLAVGRGVRDGVVIFQEDGAVAQGVAAVVDKDDA